ncbi:MAG TPA: DUF362 domain-containing protein, partial [Chloroflexota bacterium]|nr:DUF362 domain-containing protein [Chloroflexota bacterium]
MAPPIEHHALSDPSRTLAEQLDRSWHGEPWTGRRVAIAIGSRGVDRIGELAARLVAWLRAHGAQPVIIPAMGSHGGATADGQR